MTIARETIRGYIGPMYSGKTQLMLNEIHGFEKVGRRVLVLKPNIDDRFASDIVRSRAGGEHIAVPIPFDHPETVLSIIKAGSDRPHRVAFDEVQFFKPSVARVILALAEDGIAVTYSGLPQDFRGNAFPTMEKLLPVTPNLVTLHAFCMYPTNSGSLKFCGADAHMTQRLVDGKPARYRDPTVIIQQEGTSVEYEARCDHHWEIDLPKRRFRRRANS